MFPAPDLPSRMRFQVSSRPCPSGVRSPMPVTTTRRMCRPQKRTAAPQVLTRDAAALDSRNSEDGSAAQPLADELHGIANGLDVLGGVIRDLDIELFLERHHQLDVVEAVSAQVIDKAGLLGHLLGVRIEVFDNDLADAFKDVGHSVGPSGVIQV